MDDKKLKDALAEWVESIGIDITEVSQDLIDQATDLAHFNNDLILGVWIGMFLDGFDGRAVAAALMSALKELDTPG